MTAPLTSSQIAYREYLESNHWRELRAAAFKHYGRKCSRCPATNRLQVHHVVYRFPWTFGVVDDLRILCRTCHEREHGIIPQPKHQSRAERKRQKRARKRAEREALWKVLEPLVLLKLKYRKYRPKQQPKPQPQRRKKSPKWWPGMYEGKPYGAVFAEVGTNIHGPLPPCWKRTPDSMNAKLNRHH